MTFGRSFARAPGPSRADTSSTTWAIFALVSVGTFMTTLDASIANIALPTIARSFGCWRQRVQ
jgi:hypothetical protein